jgi:hypothetical protein
LILKEGQDEPLETQTQIEIAMGPNATSGGNLGDNVEEQSSEMYCKLQVTPGSG